MKKKDLSKEAAGAMEVYKLLESAAHDITTGRSFSGTDNIGINLTANRVIPGSRHQQLKKLVKPSNRILGWIGYEVWDPGLCLSVWFLLPQKANRLSS
jgi:hypothetical protein